MLAQCRRRWVNDKPTVIQPLALQLITQRIKRGRMYLRLYGPSA